MLSKFSVQDPLLRLGAEEFNGLFAGSTAGVNKVKNLKLAASWALENHHQPKPPAALVQARALTAIFGVTYSSSTLLLPTLPVHPLPTKTRDCLHLNPPLPRTRRTVHLRVLDSSEDLPSVVAMDTFGA
jgi:hypothetical protein